MFLYCFGGFGPGTTIRTLESLEGSGGGVGKSTLLQSPASTVGTTVTVEEVMIRVRLNPR